jgi:DNA repair protein RadC
MTHLERIPAEDRPRERIHRLGPGSLAAVELLALVLGSGSRGGGALHLAHEVLKQFGLLERLARSSPAALMVVPSIGEARSAALCAAFELGRRARRGEPIPSVLVEGPEDAHAIFAPLLEDLDQEAVAVLCLGARHQPLHVGVVAMGSLNSAAVHPREVFRTAVAVNAAALVLAHNHPSGDPEPSEDDVRLTRRLQRCGETLGIELIDHLVVGDRRWVSLRERRML